MTLLNGIAAAVSATKRSTPINYNYDGNLWGWWQPRDASRVILNGSNISQMTDLSGNGRHFSQSDPSKQPPRITSGVNFDATTKNLALSQALNASYTIYLVLKLNTWNSSNYILRNAAGDVGIILFDGSPLFRYILGWGLAGQGALKVGEKVILTISSDELTNIGKIVLNGLTKDGDVVSAVNYTSLILGGGIFELSEMIIRKACDSMDTIIQVNDRLHDENNFPAWINEDFIVIAGQSNAIGRAVASEITNPDYQGTLTDGYIDDYNFAYRVGTGLFELINCGVNSHSDTNGCFGLEQSLLHDLSAHLGKDIFVMKYGASGTGIDPASSTLCWLPSAGELYTTLISRIQHTQELFNSYGKRGRIKFFIWVQGEQDGSNQTWANNYSSNLNSFFSAVRAAIQDQNEKYHQSRLARVIIVKIHTSSSWPYASIIRSVQDAYAASHGDVILIEGENYALQADNKHWGADSQISIGSAISDLIKDI